MDEAEKLRVDQNFIRFVNQRIQKLANDLELDVDISTYYALLFFKLGIYNRLTN